MTAKVKEGGRIKGCEGGRRVKTGRRRFQVKDKGNEERI